MNIMSKVEMLLGGKARFSILEALAEAKKPITAYRIALIKGLDPAATYRCLTEFAELTVVESKKKRNVTTFILSKGTGRAAAEFLRVLKQKSSKTNDLENWISPEEQAERMSKIVKIDQFSISDTHEREQDIKKLLSKRAPGELSALVISAKIAFTELFENRNGMFILKKPK